MKLTTQQIAQSLISTEGDKQWVDARALHHKLGSKRQFANWIRDRINDYGFEENKDFDLIKLSNQKKFGRGGDRKSQNYRLSIDMAKELCMLERSDIGKQFRSYFIEAEKELRHIYALSTKTPVMVDGMSYYPYHKELVAMGISPNRQAYQRKTKYPNHFIKIDKTLYASKEILDFIRFNREIYKNVKVKRHFLRQHDAPVLPMFHAKPFAQC